MLIDHLFLIALAMRKIFFGWGIAMSVRKEPLMTDLMLNDDPDLVRNCAASIAGFLVTQRVVLGNNQWFTVPEIVEALNLRSAPTIAILAFRQVRSKRIIEMYDGAIRYIGGRPR